MPRHALQRKGVQRASSCAQVRSAPRPTIWGARHTAPYFHDNGAKTLRDAVAHYQRFFNFTEEQDPVGSRTLGGRIVLTVTFDSQDAARRSRGQGSVIRRFSSEEAGMRIVDVKEFELPIAHLRAPELT